APPRHVLSRESREPHTGDGSRAARKLPAYITLAVRRERPPVVCIRASPMPASLVQTHQQQQHKMPALACSRARHVGLPRSLEDLHASLLRVGARRAGISSLATKNAAAPSCSNKNNRKPPARAGNGDDLSNQTPPPP
ncbi:unnamed protein product, partial [Laminaria digitata]